MNKYHSDYQSFYTQKNLLNPELFHKHHQYIFERGEFDLLMSTSFYPTNLSLSRKVGRIWSVIAELPQVIRVGFSIICSRPNKKFLTSFETDWQKKSCFWKIWWPLCLKFMLKSQRIYISTLSVSTLEKFKNLHNVWLVERVIVSTIGCIIGLMFGNNNSKNYLYVFREI